MFSQFNTLLLPVDSQVRELDGKLLLACVAAEKGYDVIIGSRAHIHFYASRIKNAIYIAKSMRRFSNRMFKIMHDLGHRIVAWDEEGLVRLPDKEYHDHRLSPVTFKYTDCLFAWGKSNAETLKQYSGYLGQPIHIVGNPRIDVLRPELRDYFLPEVNNLCQQYGQYILINTNFGQVNHFLPDLGKQEANRDKNFDASSNSLFMANRFKHKLAIFDYFKSMIPLLANTFPDLNFILRPHPSENIEQWKEILRGLTNVYVNNDGNVIPWIMGSKGLISNGCTTSIEASILGIPTLGFYPVSNIEIDDVLPKTLCDIAINEYQLQEKISMILSNNYTTNSKVNIILDDHIANLSGNLSADCIVEKIFSTYEHNLHDDLTFFSRFRGLLHNEARTIIKKYNSNKESHRNSRKYHNHRFPQINSDYLLERIGRFNSLSKRFTNISVRDLSEHMFLINA